MDAGRRREISRLYQAANPQSADERQAFLDAASETDTVQRRELESLLSTQSAVRSQEPITESPGAYSRPMLRAGDILGSYHIERLLGCGGMGAVFLARDGTLDRQVAIKIINGSTDGTSPRTRLLLEARSAAALSHPNICTVYEVGETSTSHFISMEYIDGRSLRDRIHDGVLSLAEAVHYALEAADGLAYAHEHGVVHRDFKAANVMLSAVGRLKIVDFGLAERRERSANASAFPSPAVAGTPYVMAPEQVRGEITSPHTDLWALGILLYEMVTGRPPFDGVGSGDLFSSILFDEPPPLPDSVPRALVSTIAQCLQKDPLARGTASELRARLEAIERWAANELLPEITRLTDAGNIRGAFRLARQAERFFPHDERVSKMIHRLTRPLSVITDPAGAKVFIKDYLTPDAPWELLGETPLEVSAPYALLRWRAAKQGFETYEAAPFGGPSPANLPVLRLDPVGSGPAGMVRVTGGFFIRPSLPPAQLGDFWIDRCEVSNREYADFVKAGGYDTRRFWTERFLDAGRELSWDEAMARFRDATGQPGPATWQYGTCPPGQENYPVTGISWYEAAAYCTWAGKRLPTVFHWFHAFGKEEVSDLLQFSNFGPAPAAIGSLPSLGANGTCDMAGNVKEWVWNPMGDQRFILGGGFGEPTYMAQQLDARPPFDRSTLSGLRCALYEDPSTQLLADIPVIAPSVRLTPVSDEVFDVYRSIFSYDARPLNPSIDEVDERSPRWRRQVVSVDAAYGGERLPLLLFLPRDVEPPYQAVVWFPGIDVIFSRSRERLASEFLFDFLPQTGRALVYPIYKGMYERYLPFPATPNELRDRMIEWSKDLGRTVDYLRGRHDIDAGKIAYYGFSMGAWFGPILNALEPRLAASALLSAGLCLLDASQQLALPPELNAVNFAPRSKVPTLMMNGRNDLIWSIASSQRPLYDILGASPDHKHHVILDGGHIPSDLPGMIREIGAWFDRFLGPVAT